MEDDGKDAEVGTDRVIPEVGGKEVGEVTKEECGTLLRETKVVGEVGGT